MGPGLNLADYLRWRRVREDHLARRAAAEFEATGHPVWLQLRQLHLDDLRDLADELARVRNGS